jgi:hypothetical protein
MPFTKADRMICWTEEAARRNLEVLPRLKGGTWDAWRIFKPNRPKPSYQYTAGGWEAFVVKRIDMPLRECYDPHFPDGWLELVEEL